jgi:hypothetical protein
MAIDGQFEKFIICGITATTTRSMIVTASAASSPLNQACAAGAMSETK